MNRFSRKPASFSFKLIATTSALFLALILLVTLLSYNRYTKDFAEQSNIRAKQILDQLSLNLDNYISDLLQLSLTPYNNYQVIRALETMPSSNEYEQLLKRREIEGFLNQMIVSPRLDILQAYIIADQVYTNGRAVTVEPLAEDFAHQEWYKQALSTQDPIFIPGQKRVESNPTVKIFSIARQIRSFENITKRLAVIKVDANYSGIEEICDRVDFGEQGGLFIMDKSDNIIYSKLPKNVDRNMIYNRIKQDTDTLFNLSSNGKRYLVATSAISHTDWTIVSLNSLKEMNRNAEITRSFTILITIICSFLACIILYVLVQTFLNPLMRIVRLMKEVKLGNLSVRFPDQRADEIGYLGSAFNSMIERINEMLEENERLYKEIYESKYLQKEAQLKALSSQIRPHFMYNTLNTISLLIQVGESDQAVSNIDRLSLILRGMANINKEITLQTELDLLEAYLFIQKTRYGDRLEYSIEIDKHFYNYLIPALTLQPLAENAVVHGCEGRKSPTHIRIYSRLEGHILHLFIEDDAGGMDEEALAVLKVKLLGASNDIPSENQANGLKGGIGMINVNRRIKLLYGDAYGLFIQSRDGIMTVEIRFPYPNNNLQSSTNPSNDG